MESYTRKYLLERAKREEKAQRTDACIAVCIYGLSVIAIYVSMYLHYATITH